MALHQWQRLRFLSAEPEEISPGSVRTTVKLRGRDAQTLVGVAESASKGSGELRSAALATVDAVCKATGTPGSEMDLLGVRLVKAFEATVVIVALAVPQRDGGKRRLVGAYLADDDVVRGAAIAVLNATNRYLGSVAFSD